MFWQMLMFISFYAQVQVIHLVFCFHTKGCAIPKTPSHRENLTIKERHGAGLGAAKQKGWPVVEGLAFSHRIHVWYKNQPYM